MIISLISSANVARALHSVSIPINAGDTPIWTAEGWSSATGVSEMNSRRTARAQARVSQPWSTLLGMVSCYGRYPSSVRHAESRSPREVLVKVQCSGQECPEHEAGGLTGACSGLAVPTFAHVHRGFTDSVPRPS